MNFLLCLWQTNCINKT